jgi:hypothetical protein
MDKNIVTYMQIEQINSKLDERICLPLLVSSNVNNNTIMKNNINSNNRALNRLQQNIISTNNTVAEPILNPNSFSP